MALDQPTQSSSTRSDTFTPQSIASASANIDDHAFSGKHIDAEGAPREIRDDARLADLGYRPELRREFGAFQTFGVAFSIMYVLSILPCNVGSELTSRGVVPSIASTIIYNLPYGGPVSMVWGWLASASLIMFIGLAMVCPSQPAYR